LTQVKAKAPQKGAKTTTINPLLEDGRQARPGRHGLFEATTQA